MFELLGTIARLLLLLFKDTLRFAIDLTGRLRHRRLWQQYPERYNDYTRRRPLPLQCR
ncbi:MULTISPECIES: hypothetical protein [Sphingomonas]|uniref:Uncharacterized protein n=1 Tax=Sphingomonas trueperi TaxID=53317 RepID=A0A7X6BE28_9SPHN|nr:MULTISPECIES: hypothetical protein [Sphingomonas]NJB99754.1 hypothetical protein [Sphingomonas trueperi]